MCCRIISLTYLKLDWDREFQFPFSFSPSCPQWSPNLTWKTKQRKPFLLVQGIIYFVFSISPATLVNRLQFHFLGYRKIIGKRTLRRIWGVGGAVGGNRDCLSLQWHQNSVFGMEGPKKR